MKLGSVTPILRIFDEAKAREFYVDYLGFTVDWMSDRPIAYGAR